MRSPRPECPSFRKWLHQCPGRCEIVASAPIQAAKLSRPGVPVHLDHCYHLNGACDYKDLCVLMGWGVQQGREHTLGHLLSSLGTPPASAFWRCIERGQFRNQGRLLKEVTLEPELFILLAKIGSPLQIQSLPFPVAVWTCLLVANPHV